MKGKQLLAAALMLAASFASHATTWRYSWYPGGGGPFFNTPAEVCIWARSVFPPDYRPGQTLALGEDGYCREYNGQGYLYIMPYPSAPPYFIALQGRSSTRALPAGPVIPLSARVTWDGAPVAGSTVNVRMNGGVMTGTTDASGTFGFSYTPPFQSGAVDDITATCDQCENTASKTIMVDPAPQSCPAFGNPVAPASGAKVQHEVDWSDAAAHPLDFKRHYNSQGGNDAGLSGGWSHNWSAVLRIAGDDAVINIAGEVAQFTRTGGLWKAQRGADTLAEAAGSLSYTRAADESVWRFDAAGQLQDITARNGWRYTLTRDSVGRVASVTNAFGRRLGFGYNATGAIARVTTPDGGALNYGYDGSARLASVTYADGTGRTYRYEDPRLPMALTGIDDERRIRFASFAYDAAGRAVSTQHAGGALGYSVIYGQAAGGGHGSLGGAGPVDPALYRSTARVTSPAGGTQDLTWIGGDGTITLAGASGPNGGNGLASRVLGAGLPASDTDFLGVLTSYQWDTQRELLLASTRAAGRPEAVTSRTQWHPSWRLPVSVEEGARGGLQDAGVAASVTRYTYDGAGNPLSESVTDTATGQSRSTTWTYSPQGLPVTMTDARGATWRYTWDAAGNRTGITDPLGKTTSQAFDAAGRLTRRVAPNGLATSWTYDARGRVLSQSVGSDITRYSYTVTGQLASVTLPNGQAIAYSYDAAQRLVAASDNRGSSVQYTLDAAGNRIREEVRDATGAIARVTSRVIDSLNRLTAVQGAAGQAQRIAYDANGEPVSHTDPLNQTTAQTLDALRRPVATTFADRAQVRQDWGTQDQLLQLTDPKGVATRYTYNAFGDVMTETSPDIGSIRYTRDAMGEVTSMQDAMGQITQITRDALGRPVELRYADRRTSLLAYNAAGDIVRTEDSSGVTTLERNPQGQVTLKDQLQDTRTSAGRYKLAYAYDNGDLSRVTYPSGLSVFYRRTRGLITGIDLQQPGSASAGAAPFVKSLAWTALGQPASWAWQNGDTAARRFDADGRMTASELASYTYDAAGRINSITQNLQAQGTGKPYVTTLAFTAGYDARNRLTSFVRDGSETRYTYDANSNRLSAIDKLTSDTDLENAFSNVDMASATSQALTIEPASNRLLGIQQSLVTTTRGVGKGSVVTPIRYTLDANGAMTSDGLRTFEYDAGQRLSKVKMTRSGEPGSISYLYNAFGQRVFKGEYRADKASSLPAGFYDVLRRFLGMVIAAPKESTLGTAYVYGDNDGELPGWALLGEYDNGSAAGAGRTEYIWLPLPDGNAIPIGMVRNGKAFAIHSDHLGTPRLITDSGNATVWQWPYSAFGNNKPTGVLKATAKPKTALTQQQVLFEATPAIEMNIRMPGQYFDEETGDFYNGFRHYDSRTGRYKQADPIGMEGGLNLFGYVSGSPLSYVDPEGLIEIHRDGNVTMHAYPGPPVNGNEHARQGPGAAYHVHIKDGQGREARMSTETWRPLTPDDQRIYDKSKEMQKACEKLTDYERKLLDRVNRQVFHNGVPTTNQSLRLLRMRFGGRRAGGGGSD